MRSQIIALEWMLDGLLWLVLNAPGPAPLITNVSWCTMPTKPLMLLLILAAVLSGCGSTPPVAPSLHDRAHQARGPSVDIAVNLGLKYDGDLLKLYDLLAAEGVRCGMRAMSANEEQIVVERQDFDRAKGIVTGIIVRENLTVRVYTSPDFDKMPATSRLEVWDKGQKVREETHRLYFD